MLIRRDDDGTVATLTLDSPDTGNAISVAMAEELASRASEVAGDPAIRSVLLSANGRFFCVGGDVKAIGAAGDTVGALLDSITAPLHAAIATFLHMEKPLVVAVNGPVAGGGLGLALVGDIVLAATSAHFSMAYTGIGFSPDGASTWLLPRLIGLRRSQELALLNRRLSSDEAASIGLITRVVPDAKLPSESCSVAAALANGPVGAHAAIRRLLLSSGDLSPEHQMEAEAHNVRSQAIGAEGQEGVAAFTQKRKPDFLAAGRAG